MNLDILAGFLGYMVIFAGSIVLTILIILLGVWLIYKMSGHIQHYLVDSMGGWKTFLEYREWYHKNNWDADFQQKSLNGLVYLTNNDKKAEYYATRSALKNREDIISLIEVELTEDQLYPDENLFIENHFPSKSDVFSAQEKVLKNKNLWEKSLKEKELVAVSGIIDIKYIKEVKSIPLTDSFFYKFIKNCKEKTIEKFDEMVYRYSVVLNSGWFFNNFGNEFIDFSKLEIWEEYDYHILSYKNKEVKII